MLKLSLIIPVYNEERHIEACLDAVALQTVKPFEVILIDNNCTDSTLEIAKKFDFVKIIKQKKQGLIPSRNLGFETAKGDIFGRIDADSVIDKNWVYLVIDSFSKNKQLMGLTGLARTSVSPFKDPKSTIMSRSYFWLVDAQMRTKVMWGANMAIRREAWGEVKNETADNDQHVHEDQDISLCMAAKGMLIDQRDDLLITTTGQSYRYLPKTNYYFGLNRKTRKRHKKNGNFYSKKMIRIPRETRIKGVFKAIVPGILFFFFCFFMFPIDYFMLYIAKSKSWLD
jgi:glycosyltransferase involved in cell wall biosynthesis